ncbi:MAG: EscJ/YscJ/HrcJ family type III secretion inner membrane ring protein [Alphaproteobacteria bacterium]|nr:MAG: EscJ/YscJ/HrcJ family type III secretion inner membrane ring protein [Alphaproteobacteria bacterium]
MSRLALLCSLLLLAACGRADLYTGQSERHANEMVAILKTAGIDAGKQKVDGGQAGTSWTVTAPEGDFSRATRLLGAQGYPRAAYESLGSIFKKEGFVSSPFEERARLDYALAQELQHSISIIDGVMESRVHVTQPARDPLSDVVRPASASVVIVYRPGANLEGQVGQLRALVVNAVEGLAPENVTVVLSAAQPSSLAAAEPGLGERLGDGLRALLAPVLAIVALALGWPALRRWQLRRRPRNRAVTPAE